MGIVGFCIFFGLGTIAATFGNSPIEAAGAYIAASICLLAHAIEKAGHTLKSPLQSADQSCESQQPAVPPKGPSLSNWERKLRNIMAENRFFAGVIMILFLGCIVIADVAGMIEISRETALISLLMILLASLLISEVS